MGGSTEIWQRAFAHRVKFSTTISDLAAVLLIALLAAPAVDQIDTKSFASTANHQLAAVTSYLRNPLAIFTERSPGARGSGHLIQTKQSQFKLSRIPQKPQEQVLANVRYPSPIPEFLNDLAPSASPGFLDISFAGPGIGGGPTISPPAIPPSVAPVVATPSTAPTGTPSGTPTATPGGTTGSAVPEPGTWLMVICGMAMVGLGLRAEQRQLAQARSASAIER